MGLFQYLFLWLQFETCGSAIADTLHAQYSLSHTQRQKCQQRKRLAAGLSNILQQQMSQVLLVNNCNYKQFCLSCQCCDLNRKLYTQPITSHWGICKLQTTLSLFLMRTLPTLGPGLFSACYMDHTENGGAYYTYTHVDAYMYVPLTIFTEVVVLLLSASFGSGWCRFVCCFGKIGFSVFLSFLPSSSGRGTIVHTHVRGLFFLRCGAALYILYIQISQL